MTCHCTCGFCLLPSQLSLHTKMPSKKRRISGLGSLELTIALNALRTFQTTLHLQDANDGEEAQADADESFDKQLQTIIDMMATRVDESKVCCYDVCAYHDHLFAQQKHVSFSQVDASTLKAMNISYGGVLAPGADYDERMAAASRKGANTYMSSENLYNHLNLMERMVMKSVSIVCESLDITFDVVLPISV
jgi:hypothetical protein